MPDPSAEYMNLPVNTSIHDAENADSEDFNEYMNYVPPANCTK